MPEKPGIQLRASSYLASGKYPFVRVEQEIQILPNGDAQVLKTVEMVGDQIIVKLPEGSPVEEIQSLATKLGGQAAAKPFAPDTWLVALPRKLEAVPEALASSTNSGISIDYAEPNHLVRPVRTPNDPRFTNFNQWHLYNNDQIDKDIKAPRAWDRRTTAAYGTTNKVIVAVIDTGVRHTHEDLQANMWINSAEIAGDNIDNDGNGVTNDIVGADFFSNDGDPMDEGSHGTHCAGLIGAVGNNGLGVTGVAWTGVQIMALRFIGYSAAAGRETGSV
ncbi:MAG: S8 family serine peptidase, partial [Verrucomicrobiota bacterium]